MKKTTLLLFALGIFTCSHAQDIDYTSSILNSDFEYATASDALSNLTINPTYIGTGTTVNGQKYQWKPAVQTPPTVFYGWTVDFTQLGNNNSQGINNDASGLHGGTMLWIGGNPTTAVPENFELYQTLTGLPAGTYKVQCLLGVDIVETSQRMFANNNVQYFGKATDYTMGNNLNTNEIYSFAEHVPTVVSGNVTVLQEMKVYTTIAANVDLKIGIRTGGKTVNGSTSTTASPFWGWYKVDYFRLTKIDPAKVADATLKSLSLSIGNLVFNPSTTIYNVILSSGTTSVTPTATANIDDATVTGVDPVTLAADGTGASTITIKALDGTTTKVYTINYIRQATVKCYYTLDKQMLTVKGADSYVVYNVNGVKVADVKGNTTGTSVHMNTGIYFVKTNSSDVLKVIIR